MKTHGLQRIVQPGWKTFLAGFVAVATAGAVSLAAEGTGKSAGSPGATLPEADRWRAEKRLIDLHQHITASETQFARAVRIMDAAGIGMVVNLSGGYVTHPPGQISEFQKARELADRLYPGRFIHYFSLDFSGWDEADFSAKAVGQVEEAHRLGAAGLKEYKRLGLYLKDKAGRLIRVDDPKLDPVWQRCGELGMPVSIHVADPQAFWRPYDASNERWKELKDHPSWWFGDPQKYPPFQELLDALDRVVARHPKTTFVGVHFANNAEDLDWVEAALDRRPNFNADLAARIPEIGRHHPDRVRQLFIKHADRILFGTDFQVLGWMRNNQPQERLILGSSGNEPPPTDAQALEFFAKHWRWLETNDRQFDHMTPIQGDWTIDAIGLPAEVLRKVYFDNARRLLVRSLPLPVLEARRIDRDFTPDGRLRDKAWAQAAVALVDRTLLEGSARPALAATVRALWSERYVYFAFEAPFRKLTLFEPAQRKTERAGLWDRDVVEVFLGTDPAQPGRYAEFEVAPTGEALDLLIEPTAKSLEWTSGFQSAVRIDPKRSLWTTEIRVPLAALGVTAPAPGARWRLNLYRHSVADKAFLAWSPVAQPSAHTPARFGWLELAE
ncbi:MAG TPA: amidohydrolase family protein [Verrucomicrobiota bacterium]|nr:amidohydrolase family protein [Verrucomicrobiota bacterium]HNU52822.1 amidohydrolase family protein [Verrucomicrobiota bacterium]